VTPTPKQTAFLLLDYIREVFFGGAAGGGKSVALLMAALQYVDFPQYSALLLRRTFAQLEKRGALLDMANDWLAGTDAHRVDGGRKWTFPSGATLEFGYIDCDKDKYNYQSARYHFVGFDELTQFEEDWYRYLFSRTRRTQDDISNIPIRVRSASNPGNIGHEWVRQRFLIEANPERLFVPSKLDDNPHLDRDDYATSMREGLRAIDLAQLLDGNWEIRPSGGLFRREWFDTVDDYPHDAIVVRYWDLAATNEGDWTVGLKLAEKNGVYYVLDVQRIRATPLVVEQLVKAVAGMDGKSTHIYMEQEPGSSGVANVDNYARRVLQGYIFRADRKTGDKYVRALPVSAAAEHHNIKLTRGRWLGAFIDEVEAFPETLHDDQVDALTGAFDAIQKIKSSGITQVGSVNWKVTTDRMPMPPMRPRVIS
jgi:predicted phage terminase large subunit-like protein